VLGCGLTFADGGGQQVSLKIPDEMAPPGGTVQMKLMVTEPTPISVGHPRAKVNTSIFRGVSGIEAFNLSGDVNGVAMLNGSALSVDYITSSGTSGTDYPIMTIALPIRKNAPVGKQIYFSLDPSSTWLLGLLGEATLKPMSPAVVTVGGSISISNVVPGGGILPAGSVVSVQGIGFQSKTQIQLNSIKANAITVVSPEEIQFTLAESTNMTGQKIQVVNPDGSQDTYFTYLRGTPFGQSSRTLLDSAIPIFSSLTHAAAIFAPMAPPSESQFTGIAMQNPGAVTASVTVALYSSAGAELGSLVATLPAGSWMIRETSELTGVVPAAGNYAKVSSSEPIEMFGFLADDSAGTIIPFAPVRSQP
jgi:hypothetical protein